MTILKTYSELIRLKDFEERYNYLKLDGRVGEKTFGSDRYLNQKFYSSRLWRSIRNQVIVRDRGLDLATEGFEIVGPILVHHMNPIAISQLVDFDDKIININQLISVSFRTHQAIHYSKLYPLTFVSPKRSPGDTDLWRVGRR